MNKKWAIPTDVGTGRACSHNSANLAGAAQRPDCAPEVSTSLREGLMAGQNACGATRAGHNDSGTRRLGEGKKSKKLLRLFTASGLALIMGAGVLCGVLIAPINSAQASVSSEEILTPQEQLLAGTLELDPETDPVVYTTDYGLDIKYHNAFTEVDDVYVSSYKGSTGFLYFTMGSYDMDSDGVKDPVNWIIIGRAADVMLSDVWIYDGICSFFGYTLEKKYETHTVSDYPNCPTVNAEYYKNNLQDNTTPAGAIISTEIAEDLVGDYKSFSVTNLPVVNDNELDSGEILCLSEKIICSSVFRTSTNSNNYSGSTLQSTINTLYSSGLGLTSAQQSAIQPQSLSVYYTSSTTVTNQYMFALAGRGENFDVNTYLTSKTININANWWLRSGAKSYSTYGYIVYTSGFVSNDFSVTSSFGVRPAFVLSVV